MSRYPTFRDSERTIDFILVFKSSSIQTERNKIRHSTFLDNLGKLGLLHETEEFSADDDVVFIKLHAPDGIVSSYSGLFDIDLACETFHYRPYVPSPPSFLANPLTKPNVNDPVYTRAPESVSGEIPKKITSAERIMVVHQILIRCVFGEGRADYGIHKLIKAKVFLDAFPLHDGDYKWTRTGPLNDRQLLALYWGSSNCWNKAQPLNLIEKYYGTEYAMYFAWLGMYIKLLVPIAALSILVVLYGLLTMPTHLDSFSEEICTTNIVMCPRCHFSTCPREYISNSCVMAKLTYLFDNWCAVIFSGVVSIWAVLILLATVFMEMWQREESVLKLQWNLKSLEYTVSVSVYGSLRHAKLGKNDPKINMNRSTSYWLNLRFILMLLNICDVVAMITFRRPISYDAEFLAADLNSFPLENQKATRKPNISPLRPEFIEKATKTRYSPITGKMEPYIPKSQTVARYTVTLVSIAILAEPIHWLPATPNVVCPQWAALPAFEPIWILAVLVGLIRVVATRCSHVLQFSFVNIHLTVMCLATFGVMVYRVAANHLLAEKVKNNLITEKSHRRMIAATTGSLLSGIFIIIFNCIYGKIAIGLTNLETHRTRNQYCNAYIYKSYALEFTNNYAAIFYVAFFKGRFFTHPGDIELYSYLGGINTDFCDPTGCIVDLAILLIIIMSLKALINNITQVVFPIIKRKCKLRSAKVTMKEIPQWEKEYLMAEADEFFIIEEYMDMVIQYGFVNFFIMGFPLAPLFALFNNIAELRVDASKVIKSYRRPVPMRVVGLGAWFGILQAVTYIGVVTNALVIAFTSNFMEKVIYTHVNAKGKSSFINQTLSKFLMNEFKMLDVDVNFTGPHYCYYHGKRYPPEHVLRYQRRKDYWHHLGIKFAVVVIFEHVVIILKGLLAYAIPDIPFAVKQQLVYQEKINKQNKAKSMNETFIKKWGGIRHASKDENKDKYAKTKRT